MSSEIFVISDTHFGHKNIIGYSQRPFYDEFEMDEHMIDKWNKTIRPQDKVYHLGDVYFGSQSYADNLLSRLNGKKRLILGNHDCVYGKGNPLQKHFKKIYLFRCFKEFGLMLTHVPVHPSNIKRAGEGGINVHGHIHTNLIMRESKSGHSHPDPRYKCVCVEHTDYFPVNIEELRVK